MSSPLPVERPRRRAFWRRTGWLLLIWGLSVGTLGLAAAVLRAVLRLALE